MKPIKTWPWSVGKYLCGSFFKTGQFLWPQTGVVPPWESIGRYRSALDLNGLLAAEQIPIVILNIFLCCRRAATTEDILESPKLFARSLFILINLGSGQT